MRFLILLLLVGCALTEEEQFDRDYKRSQLIESFLEREAECKAAHGLWVVRFNQRKHYTPKSYELWTAYCTSRDSLIL